MKTLCPLVGCVFTLETLIIMACFLVMTLAEEMKPVEIPATPQGKYSLRCNFLRSRENINYKFSSLPAKAILTGKERVHGLLIHTAL